MIEFSTTLVEIAGLNIIRVPPDISALFPSRGMVMAKLFQMGMEFIVALEPDGKGSHWFELEEDSCLSPGDHVTCRLDILEAWTDPPVPPDLQMALKDQGHWEFWNSLTPKARWEWIRWIRSTSNQETRQKRLGVANSKMAAGDRRPCCFDSSRCTVPSVMKNGVLRET